MKLSVIIPNYNKVNYIEETISSLAKNRTEDVEWIVVDDGSTDDSLEILERLAKKHDQLQYFTNTRRGGSSARNYGLSKASGEFVIFLDADDLLGTDCIRNRLEMIKKFPKHDCWVFPMSVFRDEPGDAEHSNWIPREENALKNFLSHRLPWQTMQPIWKKKFLNKIDGFDERFPRLQDVELHTKAILQGAMIKCFPDASPDCFYRISENRISFSAADFQEKFIDGAVLYYETFVYQLNRQQQKYLAGTLLETLSVLNYQLRQGNISRADYQRHRGKLVATCTFTRQKEILQLYAFLQSTSIIHLKGLKRIIRTLLFF